jgi:hypothetical protein
MINFDIILLKNKCSSKHKYDVINRQIRNFHIAFVWIIETYSNIETSQMLIIVHKIRNLP